jgi:hypothetical protein
MSTRRNQAGEADEILIEALASGATYAEAGALAKKAPRTVRRRMTDSDFAAAVSARRGERVSRITGMLVDPGEEALQVLRAGLGHEEIYPQLRAAQIVLSLSLRYRAANELEERLTIVERRLAEAAHGQAESTEPASEEDEHDEDENENGEGA